MKLRELEKRLEKEPNNLGLRVTVAGLMHEAGRSVEAVELYRSVALAYRDMGRRQQAIAVCRSILELAPEDESCQALLASLALPAEVTPPAATAIRAAPNRRSSMDPTPLPKPVPYDTTSNARLVSAQELDLPTSEGADTRPGSEPRPDASGLAQAARRISGWISGNEAADVLADDLSAELETRQRPRLDAGAVEQASESQTTIPTERVELEDAVTPVRDSEELTRPRDGLPRKK